MKSFFGEPRIQYSFDGGGTWREDGPLIGPKAIMRIVTDNGVVLFSGHVEESQETCAGCNGTGKRTVYRYAQDKP